MHQLALILFISCITETIPNPHTVSNLPKEQRKAIEMYTNHKCKKYVESNLGITLSEAYKIDMKIEGCIGEGECE